MRFKNHGLDQIDVLDNGPGIAPYNYEPLALRNYTSKLYTYEDLDNVQTFGFRGEALSSLCAVSTLTVVTCQPSNVPHGTKLEFETSGKLKSQSLIASERGTKATVRDLFKNLSVRRSILERNSKREWTKVITLLHQYASIATGVRFSVSQQATNGQRMILFTTRGDTTTTRDNLVSVFGSKAVRVLIPLDLTLEMEPTKKKWVLPGESSAAKIQVRICGHVSPPVHGEGRQTPDRQMFYVNGRPCKLPQFAKVFNEVYKSYSTSKSPFLFVDIQLDTHLYDVNVSPDKRTILLHEQGRMLDTLKESLAELF